MTTTHTPVQLIDDERISAYGRLVEAQRTLHRTFDRSLRAKAGISVGWYEALLRVARSDDNQLPINELGDAMQLTSGGATRLVDRLEENGYLERVACPSDRRVLWARLTDEGMQKLADATRVHIEDLDQHFVSRLSTTEMAGLTDILRRLRTEKG